MTSYKTPADLRKALESRLKQQAEVNGTDLGRLRRRALFDRLAARLAAEASDRWVLKGGAALEFRLLNRARATKDLDLALRDQTLTGNALRDELIEVLAEDVDGDRFVFRVGPPQELDSDSAGRPAWRFSVEGHLAGKVFAAIRLDVVQRSEELAATEQIELPGVLAFADIAPRKIEAVHRRQHFAEKLHAFTRDYGVRPNTRVKDLVDLVLLLEDGLRPDRELLAVAEHVFAVRATHPLPLSIPDPPPSWAGTYPDQAANLTEASTDLHTAMLIVRGFWATALATRTES
ncbi:nucleotidyl transferase AbiEii/AbiGii toxin family protein [Sphaerisporangium album]|uniref:Nucleotidyl transferase AbiEii/AbiGii toxin family protein n=1 Tax=Sphaerisporangium album TaxID=509200 RepID=A0A367FR58_9ACTN|nr:nucleotidyl transferase AbiEii/AbiGii toxin family protein [Sphaerisporangium album]RCG32095.1 nucleotidyl transferase AbiEii/AbiGii toxin family protein [Sphaerisporangium album]